MWFYQVIIVAQEFCVITMAWNQRKCLGVVPATTIATIVGTI